LGVGIGGTSLRIQRVEMVSSLHELSEKIEEERR
jgi:hypothetical protein